MFLIPTNISPSETPSLEAVAARMQLFETCRPSHPAVTPPPDPALIPPEPPPKPSEPFKQDDIFLEKPFLPSKPISHSPKISPSSIPNPSPSVTTTKQVEPGYPSYGGYLYSIPGYSAFQPVSYQGIMPPNQHAAQTPNDFTFPPTTKESTEEKSEVKPDQRAKGDSTKEQDFEEHFTPEIIPAASISDSKNQSAEAKMSISSLTQGSGATVTIPSHATTKDAKKKTPERFSLKTSIPISKIDMKCVSNPPDAVFQNAISKKNQAPFNPAFQNPKDNRLQSNIVLQKSQTEPEVQPITPKPASSTLQPAVTTCSNNISALLNAAETINKTDNQFWKVEAKSTSPTEVKELPTFSPQVPVTATKTIYNPITTEASKLNFSNKPPDSPYGEQKNQILFIQNKNTSNPKMLLTIQQQNPQVLLQRSNFESKNLQAPSRLSGQIKKSKEEHLNENGTSSKVVALKRLHLENCDENDFENLITENQIYGNKIVVKEKSGTLQEQDLKKNKDKQTQETKNVVLQPNFLYLSNVQFPANLMMIKNNKISQTSDIKPNKAAANENKTNDTNNTVNGTEIGNNQNLKTQNVTTSKEIHVLKSSNNVLQTLANKANKTDIVFQTSNQKVIMNPQIVYQVPMIVDTDNKINQPFINREYPKFVTQNKKEYPKPLDASKTDKLFIACPYQMDSKLQPKIVITNIRSKITKVEEESSLDMYEKRRRIRRLKYLSNRETKDTLKPEIKKVQEKTDSLKDIITPDKMKGEIYKEFANTKIRIEEDSSDSESDYGENELKEYNKIIDQFSKPSKVESGKIEFLASFRLATHDAYKEKQLDLEERSLSRDAVASAYITAGRLDRLCREEPVQQPALSEVVAAPIRRPDKHQSAQKQTFLTQLRLTQVPPKYKDGYEKAWQVILQERKRRNGTTQEETTKKPRPHNEKHLDPDGQLQLLTEIKKSVNENNNLIKKRLDSSCDDREGDIHALAEKNFSELDRLSKMADRSVKLYSGVDPRKRDLNPGFDSENIQKPTKLEQPYLNYPKINIPNISKIISLKSIGEPTAGTSSPATSMDEPPSSASVSVVGLPGSVGEESERREAACQAKEPGWPGVEALIKNYKEFEAGRKKEITSLHRRNTRLRVECAQTTRAAAAEAERARALLAERRQLAREEAAARAALAKLTQAIDALRKYS